MKIALWTNAPNHYQNSFFHSLRRIGIDLIVLYYEKVSQDRKDMGWAEKIKLKKKEYFVEKNIGSLLKISDWRERIHVITTYRQSFLRDIVRTLIRNKVSWVHWSEPSHPGLRWLLSFPLKYWYSRKINKYALGAFAIGNNAARDFRKWGVQNNKIEFLPYSSEIKITKFKNNKFNFNNRSDKFFIFCGKLCHRKGIDVLLNAFSSIKNKKNWKLILVGNDTETHTYSKMSKKLDLENYVSFVGPTDPKYIGSILKKSHVFILPSRFDGWGVSLNEAASIGLALISTNTVGAANHLIENNKNGYIIDPNNIELLKNKMEKYITNSFLLKRHMNNSKIIYSNFTSIKNANRFFKTIKQWKEKFSSFSDNPADQPDPSSSHTQTLTSRK